MIRYQVSKENRECMSRHVQIIIVELAHKRPHAEYVNPYNAEGTFAQGTKTQKSLKNI